jgi:SRSO17 transposase
VTAPARVGAQHQSLLHFVGEAPWSDANVLAKVREMVLPAIERHGPIEAWIIDDTGFPKQGRHSVGVARRYCGQLGKQDSCQVAVSLSLANHDASLPVAYQLYLPKEWAKDHARRRKAGVPKEVRFKTKPQIALEQLRWACAAGLAGRYCTDGRGLWCRYRSAGHHHDAGVILRRWHHAEYLGVGARQGAAATEELVRSGVATEADPP